MELTIALIIVVMGGFPAIFSIACEVRKRFFNNNLEDEE